MIKTRLKEHLKKSTRDWAFSSAVVPMAIAASDPFYVIPAKAGIQNDPLPHHWMPAFAGRT